MKSNYYVVCSFINSPNIPVPRLELGPVQSQAELLLDTVPA